MRQSLSCRSVHVVTILRLMQPTSPPTRLCVISILLLAIGAGAAQAANPAAVTPSPEQVKFFETHVRPLLAEHCFSCHGDQKQKGGLRLDTVEGLRKGGKNGAAVVPGKPAESKLILAVSYKDE